MLKNWTGHEMANASREKERVSPSLVHQEIRRSIVAPPAGSSVEIHLKTKTILEHFVHEKTPLVNRILLNVDKCCVIKLLTIK